MKINGSNPSQSQPHETRSDAESRARSQFHSIVEKKRQESSAHKQTQSQEDPTSVTPDVAPAPKPEADSKPESTSALNAPVPPLPMEGLASQIVERLRSMPSTNASQTAEIQFKATALEGLQITLTAERDQLSIRMATTSESTAALLRERSQELKSLLANKGFKVADVVVASGAGTPAPRRSRQQ